MKKEHHPCLHPTVGFDIGGANIKAVHYPGKGKAPFVESRPFEIWRISALGDNTAESSYFITTLQAIAQSLGAPEPQWVALTMTAELSDIFSTKRDGVCRIVNAVEIAFPKSDIRVYTLENEFIPTKEAKESPLRCAAANWMASAALVARHHPDCLLMDMGSTTTDIIPIVGGKVRCIGLSDPERLASGELVYTGVIRTNPNTLTRQIPHRGAWTGVAAEYFSCMADVYTLLGDLNEKAYSCPTPDNQAKTKEASARRLARLICADTEMMTRQEIDFLARYLFEKQVQQVTEAVCKVISRLISLERTGSSIPPMAPVGQGTFLIHEVARRLGMDIIENTSHLPDPLPAHAVALLLDEMKRLESQ